MIGIPAATPSLRGGGVINQSIILSRKLMNNRQTTLSPCVGGVLILVLAALPWSADPHAASTNTDAESMPWNQQEKNSYALGIEIGKKLKRPELELDAGFVARGVRDSLSGSESLLTEVEIEELLKTIRSDLRMKQQEAIARRRAEGGVGVLADIRFAFKRDSRFKSGASQPLPDWVSPERYSVAYNQEDVMQIMAGGLDATGQSVPITPDWTIEDPGLLEFTPGKNNQAEIRFKGVGETTLEVTSGEISRKLSIKTEEQAGGLFVQLTQVAKP